jgi:hypothetical protein
MYMKRTITGIFLAVALWPAAAQQIKKTEAEAIEGKIRVTCELQATTYQDLYLSYSEDNGQSFFPCRTVAGDLINQLSGSKELIWDCAKDGVIMGSFVFRVTCMPSTNPPALPVPEKEPKKEPKKAPKPEKKKPEPVVEKPVKEKKQPAERPARVQTERKNSFLVMPGVSIGTVTSYSLMAGYAGTAWGGYAKVKSNFASKEGDGAVYGSRDLFYQSDYSNAGRFAVSAGVLKRLGHSLWGYAGIGYGSQWVEWQTVSYRIVEVEDFSRSAIEPEAGILFQYQKFLFGAGVSVPVGSSVTLEATVSIGFTF